MSSTTTTRAVRAITLCIAFVLAACGGAPPIPTARPTGAPVFPTLVPAVTVGAPAPQATVAPPTAIAVVPVTVAPSATPRPTIAPAPTRAPTAMPTRSPTPTRVPDRIDGLRVVSPDQLPREARDTLALIAKGGPFPYDRDGIVFENREGILPRKSRGYYREYTVITPNSRDRGARRIVAGQGGELYYTADHYESFVRVIAR